MQHQARLNSPNTPVLVAEQQADCFAGAYMRWVAEGKSRRFTLSTGSGLNNQLAGMLSFRDPLLTGKRTPAGGGGEHGSAFERISAFQFGFADGPSECKRIDTAEVKGRRGDLPVALQRGQSGEWPVSGDSVKSVIAALTILFKPADPPALSFNAASAAKCPDARPTPPVSFCPASNTIAVDLPALKKLGAPPRRERALRRQHRLLGADLALHAGAAACPGSAAGFTRGRAAYCLPDGRGDGTAGSPGQYSRRQHGGAHRG
ncbi:hypothetical protein A5792_28440 [Mycolicibacterium peregrinum]|uniref:Uncharacterized protein n=1 Tax=Mycolicibacterium peregrinum TaxID=43304 RepID=A0A1A0QUY0_MYCPR|nr:hypothetical protein A5792_28440 [Mycolicibacterium peregrinum]